MFPWSDKAEKERRATGWWIKTSPLSWAQGLKGQGHTFFVDTSAMTSPLAWRSLDPNTTVTTTALASWTHIGKSVEDTHLNNSLCYLIHRLSTHKLTHKHTTPTFTVYILISFTAWLFVISWNEALHLPNELRFLVLLSSCYFFCLIKDQEQTYRTDCPPLPDGAHLGCPGQSWWLQLPHLLWK